MLNMLSKSRGGRIRPTKSPPCLRLWNAWDTGAMAGSEVEASMIPITTSRMV